MFADYRQSSQAVYWHLSPISTPRRRSQGHTGAFGVLEPGSGTLRQWRSTAAKTPITQIRLAEQVSGKSNRHADNGEYQTGPRRAEVSSHLLGEPVLLACELVL